MMMENRGDFGIFQPLISITNPAQIRVLPFALSWQKSDLCFTMMSGEYYIQQQSQFHGPDCCLEYKRDWLVGCQISW